MGLASLWIETYTRYLGCFRDLCHVLIVFYTTFAPSTRIGNVEDKTIIYIYAADFPAVVHYDLRYLSVYCTNAVPLEVHRRHGGKGTGNPCARRNVFLCCFIPPPDGLTIGYSACVSNDFRKPGWTPGTTGDEIGRSISYTYNETAYDYDRYHKYRCFLFPEQCDAGCPSQIIFPTLLHAPEVAWTGYSGRRILWRDHRI